MVLGASLQKGRAGGYASHNKEDAMGREDQTDAGRKGAAAKTKITMAYQMPDLPAKGDFLPAYGGGMGQTSAQVDPDTGTGLGEMGVDRE